MFLNILFVFEYLKYVGVNTIRGHSLMTSTKNDVVFGPYRLVHFEASPLRIIDSGHLNFSLNCPRSFLDTFFSHCFIRKFCPNSKLVALKNTFLKSNNKKKERRIPS